MDIKQTSVKRVGGRSALVMNAVRSAVEALVKEYGRERVTVPMIAERAQVNPTSIYRRWGDLATLINDIATYRLDPARPLPNNGNLRQDVLEWAQEISDHYRKPIHAALLRGGAASAGKQESDCLRNRRSEAEMFVARGNAEELVADDLIDHIVAPIVYRAIFAPWSLDTNTAESLVAQLFPAPSKT